MIHLTCFFVCENHYLSVASAIQYYVITDNVNDVSTNTVCYYPCDATLVRVSTVVVSLCLSENVCLSVTYQYSIEMAALIELIYCTQFCLNPCCTMFLGEN